MSKDGLPINHIEQAKKPLRAFSSADVWRYRAGRSPAYLAGWKSPSGKWRCGVSSNIPTSKVRTVQTRNNRCG
jgi:hypothetical protein